MKEMVLSVGEPFTSPAWGSNFVLFVSEEDAVIAEADTKEYLRRVCKYARHFKVHLVPQRFEMLGSLCMCLISPEGKIIGAQKAGFLRLPATYDRGSSIEVFRTEFGGIFLCVDVDIYHPEMLRVAVDMGAQFIICSQGIDALDHANHMVISGVWNAAQSNNVFAVSACNQFHCACAPLALTPNRDGFLAPPTRKTPLSVPMQADNLASLPQRKRLSRKLFAVHRKELIG